MSEIPLVEKFANENLIKEPGLIKVKRIIDRYQNDQASPGLISKADINDLFRKSTYHESIKSSEDLIDLGGVKAKVNGDNLSKLSYYLTDKYWRYGTPGTQHGISRAKKREASSSEEEIEKKFSELTELRQIKSFFDQSLSSKEKEKIKPFLENLEMSEKVARLILIEDIVYTADVLAGEETLEQVNLPSNLKQLVDLEEGGDEAQAILDSIKRLAVATDNKVQRQYLDILSEVEIEGSNLAKALKENEGMEIEFNAGIRTTEEGDDKKNIKQLKKELINQIGSSDKKKWEKININSDQADALYDLLHEEAVEILFSGGRESWDGTRTAGALELIKSSKAIPELIKFLRAYPAGHTSTSVTWVLNSLISKPISQEGLAKTAEGLSKIDKQMVNWIRDEDSYFKRYLKMHDFSAAGIIGRPEKHLVHENLLIVAKTIAENEGKDLNPVSCMRFFSGGFDWFEIDEGMQEIEKLLLSNTKQVAKIMVESNFLDWRMNMPNIFKPVVSPKDNDFFYFPNLLARKIELDENRVEKLSHLYESKDLRKSHGLREVFAQGLLFLSSKENGNEILSSILNVTSTSSADIQRLKRVFRRMINLDRLGDFKFSHQNSLDEILVDLTEKLVLVAEDRMGLSSEDKEFLKQRIDELLDNGLLEIFPALIGQYETQNRNELVSVVKEIGRHIVRNDFGEWRNGSETSIKALSTLSEEKRTFWLEAIDPEEVKLELQKDKDRHQAVIDSIQKIASEAKAHVLEVYKLDFSSDRVRQLEEQSQGLVTDLKATENSEKKKELGLKRRSIEAELKLILGVMKLESANESELQTKELLETVSKLQTAMNFFAGLEQSIRDLQEIEKVFTTQKELSDVDTFTAEETDNPIILLNIGFGKISNRIRLAKSLQIKWTSKEN